MSETDNRRLVSVPPSPANDAYAWYGRHLMEKRHPRVISTPIPVPTDVPHSPDPSLPPSKISEIPTWIGPAPVEPVGILGAGPGGLYTALILKDLEIPFQILESSGRVGGRLFTYNFPNTTGAPYNYYDVGAMRFPQTDAMNRMFHLFGYPPLNTPDIALAQKLAPYRFSNDNCLMSYNGIIKTVAQSKTPGDHFKSAAVIQDTPNASAYISATPGAIKTDALAPFVDKILHDLRTGGDKGWKHLMKFDKYSFRAYLSLAYTPSEKLGIPQEPLPTDVVNWMETFAGTTGSFDRALSDTVLDAIAFGWPSPDDVKWSCISGGAVQIADAMYKYLIKDQANPPDVIRFGNRVTSIAYNGLNYPIIGVPGHQAIVPPPPLRHQVVVGTEDGQQFKFSNVISTIPLPVLRTLDLSRAGLSYLQSNALRELDYGSAIKVGMQFATAWWTTGKTQTGEPLNIVGGQSFTDRPIRTIVYPSFGDSKRGQATTLIASYARAEDATRLGALIEKDPKRLEKLVLKELAEIHNVDLNFLQSQLIASFPWNWDNDIDTMGAFAFFLAGKFEDLYHSLNYPAGNGFIQFAGEALSTRHAWIEGALDSAWRAVASLLLMNPQWADRMQRFHDNWGTNEEWVTKASEPTPGEPGEPIPSPAIFDKDRSLLYRHIAANAKHWQL